MRNYYIFNGSATFFNKEMSRYNLEGYDFFMDLVKQSDEMKNRKQTFDNFAEILIIPNHNYHGIVATAHDRLGPLIEELTQEDSDIYVHNPPRGLMDYLNGQAEKKLVKISLCEEIHSIKFSADEFSNKIQYVAENIVGQGEAIQDISKSMWYLSSASRKKPYVVMLYGGSSLGKTELVKEISNHFYNGKYYEKHLSMFKNNTYSDYFFGESPNRKSIGYDLLERESNLIFFDELDKCPEYFFSAFYTLFDNTIFKDATYDVNVDGLFIVCTSNYQSEDEIKKHLGLPIYYRIDKCIHFTEFTTDTIYKITMNEIKKRKDEYSGRLTPKQIYNVVSPTIKSKGENGRTIQQKVQTVIEELLFLEVKEIIYNISQ